MPSFTDRVQLIRHTLADVFRIQDYEDNWERLDQFPGVFVCTSSTRPSTWGERQAGMFIWETDTELLWVWNGSAFARKHAKGNIGYTAVTSDASTASTSLQTAATAAVTVAAGNRRHRITVGASEVWNTNELTQLAIYRGATALMKWYAHGGPTGPTVFDTKPVSMTVYDLPTSGVQTYTFQYSAVATVGGTSTIEADANNPIFISVDEV